MRLPFHKIDLIVKLFAPALRLDKSICERNCGIFDLETFPKSHAILQQGSKPPMELARIGMIVEGEVRLVRYDKNRSKKSKRDVVTDLPKDRIGPGKVLGESALYGEPFPHYAMVATDTAKVLTLRVWDLFEKLMLRIPAPLDKPLITSGTILHRTEDNRFAETEVNDVERGDKDTESSKKLCNLISETQQEFRISLDSTAVKASEWKTVPSKYMLKWRQPPQCRPHKSISAESREDTSFSAPIDLNYPREFDLFPSAQRSVLKEQRTASPDGSLVTTACPGSRAISSFASGCTDEWMFASLDGQIRKKLADAEELEVEHHLHSFLGVYMEDADRPRTSGTTAMQPAWSTSSRTSSMVVTRPKTTPGSQRPLPAPRSARTAVLLTCGTMLRTPRGTPR